MTGYGIIPTELMKQKISKSVKLVLMCLSCYAGNKNYSFPSITTICQDLEMGRTTVINALRKAEKLKLIKIEKLYPDDLFRKNNKYILLFRNNSSTAYGTTESPTIGPSTVLTRGPVMVPSKYRHRTQNINININNKKKNNKNCDFKKSPPDDAPLKLFPKKKIKVKPILENKNWEYIELLFREKKEYDNWGKQRKHVKDLDKRIYKIYENKAPPMSLKEFTKKCIDFFWYLKQNGKQIWKDQAFFPSTLNSERIWTMYLEEIKKRKQPTREDYLRGIE